MVTKRRIALLVLTTVLCAVTVAGCASTGTSTPVAVKDVSQLSGKWNGWIRTTGSGSNPATFEVTPSGDYTTRTLGFESQGKAELKGGSVVLTGTSGSGRLGVSSRVSTASLAERSGTMVLVGSGRDDIGPFEFEFVKEK